MRRIPLIARDGSIRAYALVDAEDEDRLRAYGVWRQHSKGYAVRATRVNGKKAAVWMHREILGLALEDRSVQGDHINGNRLDNRKANLRVVTPDQNRQNITRHRGAQSGHLNVHWFAPKECWVASVMVNGRIHTRYCRQLEDAVVAAEELRRKWRDPVLRAAA